MDSLSSKITLQRHSLYYRIHKNGQISKIALDERNLLEPAYNSFTQLQWFYRAVEFFEMKFWKFRLNRRYYFNGTPNQMFAQAIKFHSIKC